MAKRQTRRSISLNRAIHSAVNEVAAADGVSASEWVTRLIRAALPGLPATIHASASPAEKAVAASVYGALGGRPRTPEPEPRSPRSRLELDMLAAKRRQTVQDDIPTGTLCANCVDRPATHRGRVDKTGRLYPLCNACELPAGAGDEREQRWQTRTR